MSTETRPLDQVVPYWRNPRRVTEEAVNAVAESIRQFGYQQPIVVDHEGVIVLGHTRYAALRRLGYTHAEVRVADDLTPPQIKQLRLIDNRTSEFASWDYERLVAEMAELDEDLMKRYFPEVAADVFDGTAYEPPKWEPQERDDQDRMVEFICPSCFHTWDQEVLKEDVLTGHLRRAEA